MLHCKDCEYFNRDEATGRITLQCDPFKTIKEPACLQKLQLLRLEGLLQSYHRMLRWYQKLAPMQEKMFDMMKREIDDFEDSESWKCKDIDDDDIEDEPDDQEPCKQ